jgi:hypothetical protein
MKRTLILLFFAISSMVMMAQTDKEVNLGEVVVNGARVINKVDGQQIYPTAQQKEKSTSGYSLLNKLALPNIRIDETMHTITSTNNLGDVQVRINDIVASKADLLALDMKAIEHIDYIKNPGVRYGQDIAFVINIVTKRAVSGYVVGTDLTQNLTARSGYYDAYGRWNRGKNEFSLDYNFGYHDFNGVRDESVYNYLLEDNTIYTKTVTDTYHQYKGHSHDIQLRYNRADSDRYVLQMTLSGDIERAPSNRTEQNIFLNGDTYNAMKKEKDNTSSPVLDLYYYAKLGNHQSFTANAVGTYIYSDYSYYYDEMGKNYQYGAKGDSYSLTSEDIYENQLKPFTFSAGLRYLQKYLSNEYCGDVNTATSERTSDLYVFAQIKGHLAKLNYVVGAGMSRLYYRQATDSYSYWLAHPKLTLSYPLFGGIHVKYDFGISQHPPRPEYLSNVSVRTDEMKINAGNPNLKPNRRTEHQFIISYQNKRLNTSIETFYRINSHPSMMDITRTADGFIFKRTNQKACNLLYFQNNTSYDLIPDKLTATVTGGMYRCFNYGDTYEHLYTSYNGSVQLMAYLGNFTLQAYADNGYRWLEGENKGHQGGAYYLTATYKLGDMDISLYWQHCLQNNPLTSSAELLNHYITSTYTSYNKDFGNMLTLNFTWHLSHGRKYADIKRELNNKDKDTGILK